MRRLITASHRFYPVIEGSNMKTTLCLLLGLVVGASVGWYVRGLSDQGVRASANFTFMTNLPIVRSPILVRKAVGEVTT
jgi:hypothetical protein